MATAQQSGDSWSAPEAAIAPIRFTGFEGLVRMSYLRDRHLNDPGLSTGPQAIASDQSFSQWRAEVYALARGYIYLPGLLSFDVGAGPIIDLSTYAADGAANRSRETLYNLSCRATVLRDKPYTGTVYYEHLNPTQTVGPAQVMVTESDRYGIDLALRAPATPVPLRLEARRYSQEGRSAEQAIDERTDEVSLRADRRIGKLGDTQLRMQSTRQDSRSGSTGLPVQTTRSRNDGVTLDTRLRLGERREYHVDNYIDVQRTDQSSSLGEPIARTRDFRFDLNGLAEHSAQWQSVGRYSFSDNRIDHQDTTVNALSAGATWRPFEGFLASVNAGGEATRSTQVDATRTSLGGTASYRRDLPLGKASLTYGASFQARDQEARAGTANVVGERLILPGTALVDLRRPRVIAGSVSVSNASRTQTFVEGADYLLSLVGEVTRIQRVVGGNILDGQEVLVDYAFDVGGTYGLAQSDQSLYLGWNLESYASIYAQWVENVPRLTSGAPTFTLNTVRSTIFGARADIPLRPGGIEAQVGGTLEFEDRHETVSPYARRTFEGYLQAPFPFTEDSHIRVGARRNVVEYDLSPLNGVRLTAWDVRFWSRPAFGLEFSLDAHREKDTGMPVETRRTLVTARANWRVRQFRLSFDLTRADEWQGETRRRRLYAQLVMRRDF